MMQSAHFRERDDETLGGRLNTSWRRRVLLQGEVCSRPMIIDEIRGQQTSQMALAEDDDVVQAFAPDGSDQSLRIRILPWAGRSGDHFADVHAGYPAPEHVAVDGVAIA